VADFLNCPKCGSTSVKKVPFTWWGGALGPALLTHVKCQGCGTQFNGKTGRSNTSAIAVYIFVATGLVAIVTYFLVGKL
jgi:transposase-like protein